MSGTRCRACRVGHCEEFRQRPVPSIYSETSGMEDGEDSARGLNGFSHLAIEIANKERLMYAGRNVRSYSLRRKVFGSKRGKSANYYANERLFISRSLTDTDIFRV